MRQISVVAERSINVPESNLPRLVVIGGGFAGINFCKQLDHRKYQVVLLDRNNFHTFQPLLYQVATAGLEPSSISGPYRKLFKHTENFYFRLARVLSVDLDGKEVVTNLGKLNFDLLVLANGTKTNYFGNEEKYRGAFPLKQVSQALDLRNSLLRCFEDALLVKDPEEKQGLMTFVIVGGGPTGVEVAGAISELRNNVLPRDYPELDFSQMRIVLMEGNNRLLNGMSDRSHDDAIKGLRDLGIDVKLGTMVQEYDGKTLIYGEGEKMNANTLIWAAGVTANLIEGLESLETGAGNRIMCDDFNQAKDHNDVFVLGDLALLESNDFPNGHPQLAPVAIQQAELLSKNLNKHGLENISAWKAFRYKDKGSMATIGRNKAVVDLKGNVHFKGIVAWLIWMFIHLMSIIGFRNKVVTLVNWVWNYFTYDRSIRLILKARK